MRIKTIAFAMILFASVASAQTPATPQTEKVFDFTNKPSQQGLQEIATVLRTVGDIQHLSVDAGASTLTVTGNTDQLAMTGWVLRKLDQPAQVVAATSDQFLVPPSMERTPTPGDDVIRVFYLQHTGTPQGVQEILTVLRTVGDMQRVFGNSAPKALVVRGTASKVALAAYLIGSLDVEPGSEKSSQMFHYQPTDRPGLPSLEVRVFYLNNTKVPQQIQEILTVLRTVADIQKVFNVSAIQALAIGGSPADLAVSEWIIQSLDMPVAAKPGMSSTAREFVMPGNPGGNTVRVFYPDHMSTPQAMQQTLTALRMQLSIQKVFNYTALPALVVRGTPDMITKAEQLILARDQPVGTALVTPPVHSQP